MDSGFNGHGRPLMHLSAFCVAVAVGLAPVAAGTSAALAQVGPNVPPQVQGQELAELEAQRRILFARTFADPSNVPLALEYAELSARVGDIEGAIIALERLLIFAPTNAQLNYRLGILYMRIASWGQAAAYFRATMAAPGVSPDLAASAANHAAEAEKRAQGNFLTARFATGIRYQTNANGGSMNGVVNVFGFPIQLNEAAMATPDTNAFVSAIVHGSHDLASQGDRVDFHLALDGTRHLELNELDTLAGQLRVGPTFDLGRFSIDDATFGVDVVARGAVLDGEAYLLALGAGASLQKRFGPGTLGARIEYGDETYFDTSSRPNASELTGPRLRANLSGNVQVNDWAGFYAGVYGERKTATVARQSYVEVGASAGVKLSTGGGADAVTLDLSAGAANRRYDEADPMYSADPRMDERGYIQGALEVPLPHDMLAVGTVTYSTQLSNYDLYSFDNLALSLALAKRY